MSHSIVADTVLHCDASQSNDHSALQLVAIGPSKDFMSPDTTINDRRCSSRGGGWGGRGLQLVTHDLCRPKSRKNPLNDDAPLVRSCRGELFEHLVAGPSD